MRFIVTIIWSVIICSLIVFLLSSMGEQPFFFKNTLIVSTIICAAVFFTGKILGKLEDLS